MAPTIIKPSTTDTASTSNQVPGLPQINYTPFTVTDTDENYLITQDFIYTQYSKYKDLTPTKTLRFINLQNVFYKLSFVLSDGSTWEVQASFNTFNFICQVMSNIMVSGPTKSVPVVF